MRKWGFVLLIFWLPLSVTISQKINYNFQELRLPVALTILNEEYGFRFAYDYQIADTVLVDVKIKDKSIDEALTLILLNTQLAYRFIDDVYVLYPLSNELLKKPIMIEDKLFSLSGIVRDKLSGESLPYASIINITYNKGVSTNQDGFFSLVNLPPDTIELQFSYLGFKTQSLKVFPPDWTWKLIVLMEPIDILIDETVIAGQTAAYIEPGKFSGNLMFNVRKIKSIPTITEPDVFRTIELFPGINATSEMASGISMRGFSPDKNLVYYDGFSIYQSDHFFGVFSAFNSNAIKDVQVYKGAFDVTYGNRVGGVIDITGKSGNSNKAIYNAGINLLSANFGFEIPISSNASFLLNARRSFTDLLRTPVYNNLFKNIRPDLQFNYGDKNSFSYEDFNVKYFFYDVNAKFTIKPDINDIISVSYYSGKDNLKMNGSENLDPFLLSLNETTLYGNQGSSIRWSRKWSDSYYHNIVAGRSNYFIDYYHDENHTFLNPLPTDSIFYKAMQNNNVSDLSFNFNNQLQITQSSRIDFGICSNLVDISYIDQQENFINSAKNNTTKYDTNSLILLTAYVQHIYSLKNNGYIKLGFRYSHNNIISKSYLEPRIDLRYALTKQLSVKAAAGRYYQFINRMYSNDIPYDFRNPYVLSDQKTYPVFASTHFSTGFQLSLLSSLMLDVETYLSDNTGAIEVERQITLRDPSLPYYPDYKIFTGISSIRGTDFLLKFKDKAYESWLAYTIKKVDAIFPELNYGKPFSAAEDQRHEIKTVHLYSRNNWEYSMVWIIGSGKPWDQNKYQMTADSSMVQVSYNYPRNTGRLPIYHRLDASVKYTVQMKDSRFSLGLSLFNVYNQRNIKFRIYRAFRNPDPASAEQTLYSVEDILGLGFTPNIFVSLQF